MHLGKRIEQIAKDKKVKPAKLAEAMGLSKPSIYRILNSEHLSSEVLAKAAEALDVSITDFFEQDAAGTIGRNVSQFGLLNQSGSGNTQTIMPGGQGKGRTAPQVSITNVADLTECIKERDHLQRELVSTQLQLIEANKTVISLQKEIQSFQQHR